MIKTVRDYAEEIARRLPLCRAEDLGDPMRGRHPGVSDVVGDVRGEEFAESVELCVVEQVAV